jgi:hypothetical protein
MAVLYSQDRTPLVRCTANFGGVGVTIPASLMSHFNASETGTLEVGAVATKALTLANATVEVAALAGNSVPLTYTP